MSARMITLSLTLAEARAIERATEGLPYLLPSAEGAFRYVWSGLSSGSLDGHKGVLCVLELCARSLGAVAENEGDAIAMLQEHIRMAIAADWARSKDDEKWPSA